MINVKKFIKELKKNNINFYTGVPDSLLKEICNDTHQLSFLSDDHIPGEIICDHEVAGPFKYAISPEAKGQEFIYQCGSVKNHKKRVRFLLSDYSYLFQ